MHLLNAERKQIPTEQVDIELFRFLCTFTTTQAPNEFFAKKNFVEL